MPVCEKQDYWVQESIRDKAFEEFYCLGKELGRGATSCVYKCEQRGTGMNWAVKIINKNVDKKVVCSEIGVLLHMDNPYVIRLKEVYETPTQIFMVLELVTGGELFDRIVSRGCYTEKDAARAVFDILHGVKHLHSRGVVHRDLKPENLLYECMTDQSKLKIADFGLSRIIQSEVKMSTVCGTPGYCAPEVLMGQEYDEAADMWSVGVIAFILLCGYEPFYCENETDMYRKIIKGDYCFESEYWGEISENAKDLVCKLLMVSPCKRLKADEALQHPWVQGRATKNENMEGTLIKIKDFNARRRLKKPLSFYDKFDDYLSRKQEKELRDNIEHLVTRGTGILAADESDSALGTRFEAIDLENTEENRRRFRELLLGCGDPLVDVVSGVILSEEGFYQFDSTGKPFVKLLSKMGIMVGIRIDAVAAPLAGSQDELTIEGLDGLSERCAQYRKQGAHFAACKCTFRISETTPSYQALTENATVLARFASICQQANLVPMLEPRVLVDGDHDLETAEHVTEQVLSFVCKALADNNVFLEGTLFRLSLVAAGQACKKEYPSQEIALATLTALSRTLPPAVSGVFFSSDERADEDTTLRLDSVNKHKGSLPWPLTFSFGDAMLGPVLDMWKGQDECVFSAQTELLTRLKASGEASVGTYIGGAHSRRPQQNIHVTQPSGRS